MRRQGATAALLLCAIGFAALGAWQVERRAWKLRLIAAVDARVRAAAVDAPGPAAWPRIAADRDAYTHVRVTGTFDRVSATMVQAVTERGPGQWAIAPLRTAAGWRVLVNRGFVPEDAASGPPPAGTVTVAGLLRVSEPGGAFLRRNDPAAGRWFSRDVAAMARAGGLANVAPYFIDADGTPNPGGVPVGGMTVVAFRNAHLVYALTWFALAGLSSYGAARVWRER